jgi:hypothetical protein
MSDLKQERKEFESKKKKWFHEIKYNIEQIELQLGRMERNTFTLKKNPHEPGYYYNNDMTGEIEHHLKSIKETFEEAEDEESKLIMKEEDAEEENKKNANIDWTEYQRTVNRG